MKLFTTAIDVTTAIDDENIWDLWFLELDQEDCKRILAIDE